MNDLLGIILAFVLAMAFGVPTLIYLDHMAADPDDEYPTLAERIARAWRALRGR